MKQAIKPEDAGTGFHQAGTGKDELLHIQVIAQGAGHSGGAEVYTSKLLASLAQHAELSLLCYEGEGAPEETAVLEVQRPHWGNAPIIWRIKSLVDPWELCHCVRNVELRPADVAIASDAILAYAYHRRFPTSKLLYVPHSLVAPIEVASYGFTSKLQQRSRAYIYDRYEAWLLRQAVATLRFTKTACETMVSHYRSRIPDRFRVIPPATDIPNAPASRPNGGPLRLLFVGRLMPTKNVALLVEAMSGIRNHATLDIVGDGPERQSLEQRAAALELGDAVRFHGHQQDVGHWYRQCELFVFPSLLEYAPLVLLEAMSYGMPTISLQGNGSDIRTANQEIVRDGVDGILAKTPSEFTAMMADLVSTERRSEIHRMGQKARLAVVDRYSWQHHAQRYLDLIAELN